MLSPALARVAKVMNCAAAPEEEATAATPPSRAAMRFSKTSTVGYGEVSVSSSTRIEKPVTATSNRAGQRHTLPIRL